MTQLTMEQELVLRQIEIEAAKMTHAQLTAIYMKRSRELIQQQSAYQAILAQKWGMAQSPAHSQIPDDKVELELLRSHFTASTWLLNSLAEPEVIESIAIAIRQAAIVDWCQKCPEVASEQRQFHELSDAAKDSYRAQARAASRAITGGLPAVNCRHIEEEFRRLGG